MTLAILPTNSKTDDVSDGVDIAVVTDMGSARNNINVLSSDVVVACGKGGAGTLSEIALALKAERNVILLTDDQIDTDYWTDQFPDLVSSFETVEETIAKIKHLLKG